MRCKERTDRHINEGESYEGTSVVHSNTDNTYCSIKVVINCYYLRNKIEGDYVFVCLSVNRIT